MPPTPAGAQLVQAGGVGLETEHLVWGWTLSKNQLLLVSAKGLLHPCSCFYSDLKFTDTLPGQVFGSSEATQGLRGSGKGS